MSYALFAPVTPSSGGFGMNVRGCVSFAWPDPADRTGDARQEIDAFLEASRENGFDVTAVGELDGRIYSQNGAQVYRAERGDDVQFFVLWESED